MLLSEIFLRTLLSCESCDLAAEPRNARELRIARLFDGKSLGRNRVILVVTRTRHAVRIKPRWSTRDASNIRDRTLD